MIHDYKTARSICGFVEFVAWAAVVLAAFLALMALAAASSSRGGALALTGLVPAFSLALAAFIVIVMIQMARATMDGSAAAQKNVIQSQAQHQEMMNALRSYGGPQSNQRGLSDIDDQSTNGSVRRMSNTTTPMANGTASLEAGSGRVDAPQLAAPLIYRGATIKQTGPEHFLTKGMMFKSLEEAKAFIDPVRR